MSEHRRKGPSRFGRSLALGLVTAAIFLGLILGGAAWAGWTVTNNGLSLPKLRLDGILLGSMTEEEMTRALRDAGWDRRTELSLTVHFPLDLSMTLSRLDANAAVPAEDAARELMKLGHGTDWFENLSKYLRATFSSGYDVILRTGGLNENYIRANLRSVTERFDALTGDPDLHLDTDSARLTMTKGGGALSLNGDRIFAFVSDALRGDAEEVSWTEMDGDVRLPDFGRVAADLCVEARDAAFAEDFSVIPEVVGCDFDITEAEKAWREALPGTEVVIPLRLTRPAVTAADLESLLYRDRLCFMTTYYRDSTDNRKNNIRLAASKLDGITLLPGQVFSYNEAIGQRTEEAGFLL
ncbi:MAG: VanW family protein, partial [Oscillospiraceae bacterium]|nr:VanW family protein [Oscillospiraceae bacterium]